MCDDFIRQPFAEKLLLWVSTHIFERQNSQHDFAAGRSHMPRRAVNEITGNRASKKEEDEKSSHPGGTGARRGIIRRKNRRAFPRLGLVNCSVYRCYEPVS